MREVRPQPPGVSNSGRTEALADAIMTREAREMRRLEDLETLTEQEKQMLREVKRAVLHLAPDAEVILYGSTARGERGPESDYDVLVLVERPMTRAQRDGVSNAVYDVELEYGTVILSMVFSREDWSTGLISVSPYRENVEREGAVV